MAIRGQPSSTIAKHGVLSARYHACMFWLRNRQRQYWQAKPEVSDDDTVALLDAAGESMCHAGD